ncbi:hypothetical protein ACFSKU_18875 [Pontibacter silvestris]|uniref:Outer membrane protein beta-barrel domain-containing protein n=1 Tax=Pontibacter silvestris TaxID=2305183 RepID=A0ABW4X3S3_9BACT|nr:hypothetical protein [Pontibacter silvestris]MCC9135044.1 hypothetical protein [Pontibacter silvestris]
MKKTLLPTALLFLLLPAIAQAQDEEIQTLGGKANITGAYGAVSNKFSSINGDFANLVGGYGGILLNKTYLLGLGGYVTVNPVYENIAPLTRKKNELVYFGIMNEYTLRPSRLIHLSFSALAGAALWIAQEQTRETINNDYWNWGMTERAKGYVVVDPGVEVNINILKNLKIAGGVSYRGILGNDTHNASEFAAQVTVKAGKLY